MRQPACPTGRRNIGWKCGSVRCSTGTIPDGAPPDSNVARLLDEWNPLAKKNSIVRFMKMTCSSCAQNAMEDFLEELTREFILKAATEHGRAHLIHNGPFSHPDPSGTHREHCFCLALTPTPRPLISVIIRSFLESGYECMQQC